MVDFARLNEISRMKRAIEHKGQAVVQTSWLTKMADILELPVAAWDNPGAVAGEIDTERRRTSMSWNNGQGGGYEQDVYGRLNNTKEVRGGAKFPYIEPGRHKLAVVTMEEFTHSEDGPSARVLFEVLESTSHKVGEIVVKIYKLVQPAKFKDSKSDADLFADFCLKLKGAAHGYPIGNDIRVLMKDRVKEQLARGSVIDCTGVPNKKGTWTNLFWTSVPQAPEAIAAMRARIEQKGVPHTGNDVPQQMPQTQYGAPPQGYAPPPQAQGGYTPPPAPAPQQGGFAAQLPPTGNNGDGNQGGRW